MQKSAAMIKLIKNLYKYIFGIYKYIFGYINIYLAYINIYLAYINEVNCRLPRYILTCDVGYNWSISLLLTIVLDNLFAFYNS